MPLGYYLAIWSVVTYVEKRVKTKIDYVDLEKEIGFSLAHIRDIFAKQTGQPLSAYILERKIANAAFEISHTKETLLAIAQKYGFGNPDTFTRAFHRIIGLTPSAFRKKKISVGRIKLCVGVYSVGFTPAEIRHMKGLDANE